MQEESPFDISIYFPSKYIRRVVVKPMMQISALRLSAIPKDLLCNLIFSGFLLDESKTFDYYQIKKGDVIIVSTCTNYNTRWLKITESQDNLSNALELMTNKKVMNEACRLKDLRFNRLELKSSRYIKLDLKSKLNSLNSECIADCSFNCFPSLYNRSSNSSIEKSFPTVIPETMAEKPFDEALTYFFNE